MLARVLVVVPDPILLIDGDDLPPLVFAHPSYTSVRLLAPYRSDGPKASGDAEGYYGPTDPQGTNLITMGGRKTFHANVLPFEFRAAEFDRTPSATADRDQLVAAEPAVRIAVEFANTFLRRYRALTRFGHVREVSLAEIDVAVNYRADDGSPLPRTMDAIRWRLARGRRFTQSYVVPQLIWNALSTLPETFEPPVFDVILLDATEMLPNVGAAIVLALTAIEVCAATTIAKLAELNRAVVSQEFWNWMMGRGWNQQPSTQDELGGLMTVFAGRSLKDDKDLWRSFERILFARNGYAHQGLAMHVVHANKLSTSAPLTPTDALELLAQAARIVDWIEEALPVEHRRPRLVPLDAPLEVVFSLPAL